MKKKKNATVKRQQFLPDSVERFNCEVEPQIEALPDLREKIRFLKKLIIEFESEHTRTELDFFHFYEDGYYARCKRALAKYEQLTRLEDEGDRTTRAEANARRVLARLAELEAEHNASSDSLPTASAKSKTPRLTIAQQVWAVHYLLEAAGMSYAHVDKTNVARFIVALTGSSYDNVYKRVRNLHQKDERATQKDLAAIRAHFELLGLLTIVEEIEGERDFG